MYPDIAHSLEGCFNALAENSALAAPPLVSVVIPCYNHAHFLSEAIESVLAQTHPSIEVIVIDDGSTDATAEVAARYPEMRYHYQKNQGLAAARNTGIRKSTGSFLVFLDADDRLLPMALEVGLHAIASDPECAFVYGTFRWMDEGGTIIGVPTAAQVGGDMYGALLRRNCISMHATVMYRRAALETVGGFNPALSACEDYDLYLRLARHYSVHHYAQSVADYRMHSANMSGDRTLILRTSLAALRAQWRYVKVDKRYRQAYDDGVAFWLDYCKAQDGSAAAMHGRGQQVRLFPIVLRYAPGWLTRQASRSVLRKAFQATAPMMSSPIRRRLRRRWSWLAEQPPPPVGQVRFGDLRRTGPIDRCFGYGRGLPVDRYYIEAFLVQHAQAIQGHVLEIKDNAYTRQFGGDRVLRSEVLDIDAENPMATLVGDLADAPHLPSNTFDCIILTQTLHLIYDVPAALATVYRILKPGGVVLATIPGITKVDSGHPWYWAFTPWSAQRLFEDVFPPDGVTLASHGNVFIAQAFLQGLAVSDVRKDELDYHDAEYPVSIVVRAVKPG